MTYRDRGTEVSRYADDFLAAAERLGRLDYLKLGVSEPEAYGLNRNVTVELAASGANDVRVQSIQESWALGKAEFLAQTLRKNQKSFVTTVRRFGLNLNTVIIIISVAVAPELSLGRRFVFLIFALILVVGIIRFHAKFIPNVAIHLAGVKPGFLRRSWPQILSWLVAGTSAVAASIVYGLLKNEITLRQIAKAIWPWSS